MSKAQLQAHMKELRSIMMEMKRLSSSMKTLRARKEETEGRIMETIQELPDEQKYTMIKYQDITVQLKQTPVMKRKPKKEAEKAAIEKIIEEFDLDEEAAKRFYEVIQEQAIGEEETKVKLAVKEEKKNEKVISRKTKE